MRKHIAVTQHLTTRTNPLKGWRHSRSRDPRSGLARISSLITIAISTTSVGSPIRIITSHNITHRAASSTAAGARRAFSSSIDEGIIVSLTEFQLGISFEQLELGGFEVTDVKWRGVVVKEVAGVEIRVVVWATVRCNRCCTSGKEEKMREWHFGELLRQEFKGNIESLNGTDVFWVGL